MRWLRWAESALRDALGMQMSSAVLINTAEAQGGGVSVMAYDQRYAQSEV